ncbi:S-layer homology domain-containing protein [Sporosarcina gallistercoris]|uniref:S-layer homology domain-containing protein n=1 Tax=Sporosarcina gallistercoris TaxID=2762245 RepID=UPI003D2B9708
MRNWIVRMLGMCLLGFILVSPEANAKGWQEGDIVKGDYRDHEIAKYPLVLTEDKKVTFSMKDEVEREGKPVFAVFSVAVYDEAKKQVAGRDSSNESQQAELQVNLKKGTYTIQIVGKSESVGGEFQVSYQTSPVEGMDLEPNNSRATAPEVKLGETVFGQLNGRLVQDDMDMYKVILPSFGKLTFHLQQSEPPSMEASYFHMDLYSERNEKLDRLSSFGGRPNEFEILLPGGTYYFPVSLQNSNLATANYSFSTRFEPLNENEWESGKNKNFETSDLLKNNKTIRGFWYEGYENYSQTRDHFKFTIAADTKITFTLETGKVLPALQVIPSDHSALPFFSYFDSDTTKLTVSEIFPAGTYDVVSQPRFGPLRGYEEYRLLMQMESFKDVLVSNPYYEQIETLAQLGINKGYKDGTFHPAQAIQRKHIFALINRMDGLKLPRVRQMRQFKDLPSSHPNYQDIKKFYEAGIIDGSGNYMKPEANLTRAELAKILVNTFDLKLKGNGMVFSDVNPKSGLSPYIQILASNGITVGTNGKFMPTDSVTRQHFSVFLLRIIEMQKQK